MPARKCYFVIPAGGSGNRFGGDTPKQYISILGKPLLLYTLEAIMPFAEKCILAVSETYFTHVGELIAPYSWATKCRLVKAGEMRYDSVKSALEEVPDKMLVAIHDAVRPLIAPQTISRLLLKAQDYEAVVPCKAMSDSMRQLTSLASEKRVSIPVDRSQFVTIQTPQVFHSERIKEAYTLPYLQNFTDDSSVYEACFHVSPQLLEDPYPNLKVTHPEDRLILEALLMNRKE